MAIEIRTGSFYQGLQLVDQYKLEAGDIVALRESGNNTRHLVVKVIKTTSTRITVQYQNGGKRTDSFMLKSMKKVGSDAAYFYVSIYYFQTLEGMQKECDKEAARLERDEKRAALMLQVDNLSIRQENFLEELDAIRQAYLELMPKE